MHVEILMRDLRFAGRSLQRSPAFTLGAVLALALGIGAGTAVFSVVDRILFRSLPCSLPCPAIAKVPRDMCALSDF
jgi:ABC-type nitrate/sulfonate/bicarbonate transport system permease component